MVHFYIGSSKLEFQLNVYSQKSTIEMTGLYSTMPLRAREKGRSPRSLLAPFDNGASPPIPLCLSHKVCRMEHGLTLLISIPFH